MENRLKEINNPEEETLSSGKSVQKPLSFTDHLSELRIRLIKCIIAVVVTASIVYAFIEQTIAFLINPVGEVVFTSPGDAFVARITLTLFGGVLLAFPYVLFHIWQFVSAGLREEEKKYVKLFGPASGILFIIGCAFAYGVCIPISLKFLLGFSNDLIVPMINIKSYFSFIGTMLLAFGVIFELPLILVFLAKIGIATPEFLKQKRKYAIIIILIASALITPPDVITQLIMAVPLIILYEIGIVAVRYTIKVDSD